MSNIVSATLRYARGDGEKLLTEKPYILTYPVSENIPWSNFKIDFFPGIKIHSLRSAHLDYHRSGITMADLNSCMPREDFDEPSNIENVFLPSVHRCIRRTLGVKDIYIFDYMIRKRKPSFPYHSPSKDTVPQPALSAHIDYTPAEINERLHNYFGEKAEELKKRHFQAINLWKPLNGPLRDYPLAYCDASTVDPETDLMITDEVFPKMASEIYQVLYNPAHKWYWIPDQTETEIAIFAGYDSRKAPRLAVPHCSFDLGDLSDGKPRQSIEVRAISLSISIAVIPIDMATEITNNNLLACIRKPERGTLHDDQRNSQHASEQIQASPDLDTVVQPHCEDRSYGWNGPNDPANPKNWSTKKKWALVVMNSALTFCQYNCLMCVRKVHKLTNEILRAASSTIFAPAVSTAMADLGSNDSVIAQLLVSIYVVGLAVGPLALSPLSELYGRSPIMHGTNAGFLVSAIVCAVSVNIPMVLVFRLIMGVCTISLGGAYVADLMEPKDRGRAMNVWNVGPVMQKAPIIGPIVGGYLSLVTSWRWTFGAVSITASIPRPDLSLTTDSCKGATWLLVCLALLPETYSPRLLEIKASRLHRRSGCEPSKSVYSNKKQRRETILGSLIRPWQMIFRCQAVTVVSMFGAVAYSYMYFMFSTFTDVFERAYQFNAGESGLAYLGLGIGSIAAQLAIEISGRRQARHLTLTSQTVQPEQHLRPLVLAGIFLAGGQVLYGWSLHYRLHWAIPIFGTGLSGFGIVLVFQAVQAYLVEAYTLYAASAIASSVAIRCAFGLTVPLAGPRLYRTLGYGWGNTLLGCIALMMVPASLWLLKTGSKLRNKSSMSGTSIPGTSE
ncbi:Efflux pump radE [Pseudocercospora fuligena]|uniref:Efflux pump radE n=1 Tax=Pseudocercospora fuligena TaxID=685502 RepID=A0A8H6RRE6_9PEZI|nr:Efflux pump radE [Pseudocercospora fuligena]